MLRRKLIHINKLNPERMKYLITPLYKSIAIFVLGFMAIYLASYCVEIMQSANFSAWFGIDIRQFNQEAVTILSLYALLLLGLYFCVEIIFKAEDKLKSGIFYYIFTISGLAILTESGLLHVMLAWDIYLAVGILLTVILFAKYYWLNQSREEEN